MSFFRYIIFVAITLLVVACNLSKGYESLMEYNYFDAKQRFEKSLKRDSSMASYGLATIYERQDNPFSNLDSAYKYIRIAEEFQEIIDDKDALKFKTLGYSQENIKTTRLKIQQRYFKLAQKRNTIAAYRSFLLEHDDSPLVDSAILLRDIVALNNARQQNNNKAYAYFLNTYPKSIYSQEVQKEFDRTQYEESAPNHSLEEYLYFISTYQNNRNIINAKRKVYELSTANNTLEEYKHFVKTYPNYPQKNLAWNNLYKLYTADYSKENIRRFKQEFPEFPNQNIIEQDLSLIDQKLLPFEIDGVIGYMDYSGNEVIHPMYLSAGYFKDGLALVECDNKYGFINKAGNLLVPCIYDDALDFQEGRAVVAKGDLYGMIDRTGKEIIPLIFEDIGNLSNNLFYGLKDSMYAYYDNFGHQIITEKFDEAFGFEMDKAKVVVNGKVTFINGKGQFLIDPIYEEIRDFTADTYIATIAKNEQVLINSFSKQIISDTFDFIGKLSDDRALVKKDDKIGYINEQGVIVIPFKYESYDNIDVFGSFKNNYAKVKLKGKFGLIDSLGNKFYKPIFTNIGVVDTLIAITKGDSWGFANHKTQLVIPYQYQFAESFKNGVAIVKEGNYGLINTENEIVLPFIYADIRAINNALYLVEKDNNFGIVNALGDIVVEVAYQQIIQESEDLFVLSKAGVRNYFYLPNQSIITIKKGE